MAWRYNPKTLSFESDGMAKAPGKSPGFPPGVMRRPPPPPPDGMGFDDDEFEDEEEDRQDAQRRARNSPVATTPGGPVTPDPFELPEPDAQQPGEFDELNQSLTQAMTSGDFNSVTSLLSQQFGQQQQGDHRDGNDDDEFRRENERISQIPAPPGYQYAYNPLTKATELVDLTPLDPTKPLAGWKWTVNNPEDPNDGHWLFLPTPDVLDKPFEGIPEPVIGWLQASLNQGGNLDIVPEGPARQWVQFLMTQATNPGRRPEEVPFGVGLPNFPRADMPAAPGQQVPGGAGTGDINAAMQSLQQLITSGAPREQVIQQVQYILTLSPQQMPGSNDREDDHD